MIEIWHCGDSPKVGLINCWKLKSECCYDHWKQVELVQLQNMSMNTKKTRQILPHYSRITWVSDDQKSQTIWLFVYNWVKQCPWCWFSQAFAKPIKSWKRMAVYSALWLLKPWQGFRPSVPIVLSKYSFIGPISYRNDVLMVNSIRKLNNVLKNNVPDV